MSVPILSCAVVIWLLGQLTPNEARGLGALLVASILLFAGRRAVV